MAPTEDKSKGPELCFSLQLRHFKKDYIMLSPVLRRTALPLGCLGGKEHWTVVPQWKKRKTLVTYVLLHLHRHICSISHRSSCPFAVRKLQVWFCPWSVTGIDRDRVRLSPAGETSWTYWPACKVCLHLTPGAHSTPGSALVFHVFFDKERSCSFGPLITIACLVLSRHLTNMKPLIKKLIKHEKPFMSSLDLTESRG